ncbi:MAG: ROK family protein [Rhizobiaceae bacterium]|nr:ROK family protein [Rhizobiaceae bacterium]
MTVGIRHDDLRRRNRAMVIGAVRRAGQPSRTEIAGTTALSHSTISAIASDLIGEGVLVEQKSVEAAALKRGRPQVAIALNPRAGTVVAIVLSLNSLTGTLIDYSGQTIASETRRFATQVLPRNDLIGETLAIVRRLVERGRDEAPRVMRIVLAIQGITDSGARTLLWSPIMPHTDIGFADLLEGATGIPVTVENDCNMMAVSLRWRHQRRYRDNFIALLLSHGIGMGLVLRGEVFTGTRSSGAEFGHMIHRPGGALCRCGRQGCVEAYAGSYAIWRNAMRLPEDSQPAADIPDEEMARLAEKARAGDGPEREAFRKAGAALGFGLGSVFALFDPAPVAMVGHGASAFDLMEGAIREAIAQTAGGQHSNAISFDIDTDEMRLIREGCAMRALTFVDDEIFAPGSDSQAAQGRIVA